MNTITTTVRVSSTPRMALLLVLSLLVHLLLLLALHRPTPFTLSTSTLDVTLVDTSSVSEKGLAPAKPAPSHQRVVPKPHPVATKTETNASLALEKKYTPNEETPRPLQPQASPLEKPSPAENSTRFLGDSQSLAFDAPPAATEANSDTISAQIRTRFADHFVYPLLAQRNGWEGEVVLGFHVATDGTLSDIQVIQSSGYPLLDEAALSSLRAIGKIEFTSGAILQRTLELRMPVVYHLAQG